MNNTVIQEPDFVLDCRIDSDKKSLTAAALAFIYLTILFGNFLVILVILLNHQLQTPMFFYVGALSVVDTINSSTLIPQMICALLLKGSVVPNRLCLMLNAIVGYVEVLVCLILALMAYDRYVAVLNPLRYHSIITNKTVFAVLLLFNCIGIIGEIPFIILAKELPFCNINILQFCYCEYATMVRIACTDDPKYLLSLFLVTVVLCTGPLTMILFSYGKIAHAVLKIPSSEGKSKLYNTCMTQLLVIGTQFGPLTIYYLLPATGIEFSTAEYNTIFLLSNAIPPMLNPIIYSFRNQEIKKSISKLFTGKRTVAQIGAKK